MNQTQVKNILILQIKAVINSCKKYNIDIKEVLKEAVDDYKK